MCNLFLNTALCDPHITSLCVCTTRLFQHLVFLRSLTSAHVASLPSSLTLLTSCPKMSSPFVSLLSGALPHLNPANPSLWLPSPCFSSATDACVLLHIQVRPLRRSTGTSHDYLLSRDMERTALFRHLEAARDVFVQQILAKIRSHVRLLPGTVGHIRG